MRTCRQRPQGTRPRGSRLPGPRGREMVSARGRGRGGLGKTPVSPRPPPTRGPESPPSAAGGVRRPVPEPVGAGARWKRDRPGKSGAGVGAGTRPGAAGFGQFPTRLRTPPPKAAAAGIRVGSEGSPGVSGTQIGLCCVRRAGRGGVTDGASLRTAHCRSGHQALVLHLRVAQTWWRATQSRVCREDSILNKVWSGRAIVGTWGSQNQVKVLF